MARKRRFADLIEDEMGKTTTDLQTYGDTKSENKETSSLAETSSKTPKDEVTDPGGTELPKYQTLDRKETRLRADQIEALNTLTKDLNRKRRSKGERLTDNTLIRVAVDLLLSRSSELQGITEEELRQSLKLTE